MVIHISKSFLLALGAICLVALGAVGAWAGISMGENRSKEPVAAVTAVATTPAAVVPVQQAAQPIAPVSPAAEVAKTVSSFSEAAAAKEPVAKPGFALAEIIRVRPHYVVTSVPYRSCHMEPRTVFVSHGGPTGAGVAIGGITGGLVGHQFGRGDGNVAATIGGTILGAVVGNQMERDMARPRPHTIFVRVCNTRYAEKTVRKGYEVTYNYQGQTNTMITKRSPTGDTIAIPVATN